MTVEERRAEEALCPEREDTGFTVDLRTARCWGGMSSLQAPGEEDGVLALPNHGQ